MITIQKEDYNKQYEWLFNKANTLLSLSGDEAINSLDTYFTKLGTIVEKMAANRKFDESYFLLPFDEPMFNIDANTRDIIVPEVFKKGVAVQGDHASEILVFKIARYFDYKDLGNDDITIYVQYTAPDGKENMYQVGYKDLETYPGEVRFGWILSDVATNAAGTLKFSVRFVTNNIDGTTYSLNTKTQTITIYPALQKDTKAEIDGLASETAFYKYIRNSLAAGQTPAQTPRFDDKEAQDLVKTANLGTDNTLTLVAQATKGDSGELVYTWKYNPNEDDSGVYTALTSGDDYEIKDVYVLAEGLVAPNPREDYYDKDGETYTKHIFAPGEDVSKLELYEKFNQLTIKDTSAEITGKYYVEATNTLNANNVSNAGASSVCIIPGLKTFEVIEDLSYDKGIILAPTETSIALVDDDEIVTEYNAPSLKVTFKADPGAYYCHSIVHKNEEGATDRVETGYDESRIVGEDGIITIEYPFKNLTEEQAKAAVGTYAFSVAVKKNRDIEAAEANVESLEGACARVTFAPGIPTPNVEISETAESPEAVDGIYTITSAFVKPENAPYVSDTYNYSWEIDVLDTVQGNYVTLTEKDAFVIEGLHDATIKIDKKLIAMGGFVLRDRVTNTLNGQTSGAALGQKYILTNS